MLYWSVLFTITWCSEFPHFQALSFLILRRITSLILRIILSIPWIPRLVGIKYFFALISFDINCFEWTAILVLRITFTVGIRILQLAVLLLYDHKTSRSETLVVSWNHLSWFLRCWLCATHLYLLLFIKLMLIYKGTNTKN